METAVYRVRETERVASRGQVSNWRIVFAPLEGDTEEALVVVVPSTIFAELDLDAPYSAADIAELQLRLSIP
jgi:hypothetical protein